MIEQALKQLNAGIETHIKVIGTGRSIAANAQSFNEMIRARDNLVKMKGNSSKSVLIKCEHCGEENTKAMHGRWHGDKCKAK